MANRMAKLAAQRDRQESLSRTAITEKGRAKAAAKAQELSAQIGRERAKIINTGSTFAPRGRAHHLKAQGV